MNGGGESRRRRGIGRNKKFILKPIGVDDAARNSMMTLLPFPSREETKKYVDNLGISPSNPFQLQQFIDGEEYCTHALVVRGKVTAFVACPSSELLMHYLALPAESRISRAMLRFTQRVAEAGGEAFTGHLSFDFLVPGVTPDDDGGEEDLQEEEKVEEDDDDDDGDGKEIIIYPIECNPRAHTAITLFSSTPALASAYLSIFSPTPTLQVRDPLAPRPPVYKHYWLGHDVVALLILPLLDAFCGLGKDDGGSGSSRMGSEAEEGVLQHWTRFWERVSSGSGWRDGTFALEDPWPFWVLYHVYWPGVFLGALLRGKSWSRVNVSTTKVFDG